MYYELTNPLLIAILPMFYLLLKNAAVALMDLSFYETLYTTSSSGHGHNSQASIAAMGKAGSEGLFEPRSLWIT